MQFFSNLVAFVSIASLVGASPATITQSNGTMVKVPVSVAAGSFIPSGEVVKPNPNDFDIGDVWTNPNEGGTVGFINVDAIPSGCRNFIDPFIDSVTSILVQGGLTCTFFLDASCRGSSVTVQNGILAPELTGTNFDNNLSSFECSAL